MQFLMPFIQIRTSYLNSGPIKRRTFIFEKVTIGRQIRLTNPSVPCKICAYFAWNRLIGQSNKFLFWFAPFPVQPGIKPRIGKVIFGIRVDMQIHAHV